MGSLSRKAAASARRIVLSALLLVYLLMASIGFAAADEDVILSGNHAIDWLVACDYIDANHIPKHNFNVFRTQVFGGKTGPWGLKAIMAMGWSLSGPLNNPIGEPIVIIVPRSLVDPSSLGPLCSSGGNPVTLPRTWKECEDSNVRICGTWVYDDNSRTFSAAWTNGATATLKLVRFDSYGVTITREDQAGASRGLRAVYTGRISPTGITHGTVKWTWGTNEWTGTWSAKW
jgi:hypothetical protein